MKSFFLFQFFIKNIRGASYFCSFRTVKRLDVPKINVRMLFVFFCFYFSCLLSAAYCSINDSPLNGGVVNRTKLSPGSRIQYFCNRGYYLVGSSNATCRLNSNGLYKWDSPPPFCQGKSLNLIIFLWVKHLEKKTSNTFFLFHVAAISCGIPLSPGNGSFHATQFTVGSQVTYYCSQGYHLDPAVPMTAVCLEDGSWSNSLSPPRCLRKCF